MRITDTQVRSADRPECQLAWMRSYLGGGSGTESRYDPCGNSGTYPVLTSEDLHGRLRR